MIVLQHQLWYDSNKIVRVFITLNHLNKESRLYLVYILNLSFRLLLHQRHEKVLQVAYLPLEDQGAVKINMDQKPRLMPCLTNTEISIYYKEERGLRTVLNY